jgi:hypothetical protein
MLYGLNTKISMPTLLLPGILVSLDVCYTNKAAMNSFVFVSMCAAWELLLVTFLKEKLLPYNDDL